MATYYVDPAATGTKTGASWTNAWTGLQLAIDGTGGTKPVAGDTVLMRGTEVVTVTIDMDGNSGTATAGHISFIGVNASGTNDGTKYVLNGNNTLAADIINWNGPDWIKFENIEVKNTTGNNNDGISFMTSYVNATYNVFNNIHIHHCYIGIYLASSSLQSSFVFNSRFENNRFSGVYKSNSSNKNLFFGCTFKDNGSSGFAALAMDRAQFINCIFDGNATHGITSATSGDDILMYNCVMDGNSTSGISLSSYQSLIILGCRITENGTGINIGSRQIALSAFNYMPASGQARDNTTQFSNGSLIPILINGENKDNFAGTDAGGGYVDATTSDFNLIDTATLRQEALTLG